MSERILGEAGTKRRRRFLLVPILMVACTALFYVAGAQAVHKLGAFELEGNATTEHSAGETAGPPDDWDRVCYSEARAPVTDGGGGLNDADARAKCSTTGFAQPGVSTTATVQNTAFSWVSEPNRSTTIFTGGGSKDPSDISNWAYKNSLDATGEKGGLPDKDNLRHAFAARYTVTSTNCGGTASCDVVYFGSDRFDNSGDAQQGFWFLQNEVSESKTIKVGGGLGFDGTPDPSTTNGNGGNLHRIGDLLVISDFSNGGTTSTIKVLTWDPSCTKAARNPGPGDCADANLRLQDQGDAAKCTATSIPDNDRFCGNVNASTITMPWTFADKTPTPNNGALNGEFFEAGVNLTPFNLGGECFATVVSETRSSTATSAVLKDFIRGKFGHCTSETTSAQNWLPNDSGTVSVVGKSSWEGTLNFTLYDGPDCGTTNSDGTPGPTVLYQEDSDPNTPGVQGIHVYHNISGQTDTTFPVPTHNTSVKVDATYTPTDVNGAVSVSWKVQFTHITSGVPDSFRCEATTGLAIDDDVAHG